jgi:trimethylamine--corrinoid protein Co-methyltransferase
MAENMKLKLLTESEVSALYEKCIYLLSSKGVKVTNHQEALKILDKGGAQVDYDNEQVKFPREVIEDALRSVPNSIAMAGQIEENDFTLPDAKGVFCVSTATGPPIYVEPETQTRRDVTLADVAEWGQLSSVLDEINAVHFPSPQDTPEETTDVYALKTLFENTTKHIITQPYSRESIKYLFELAIAAAGSEEAFKKRPSMSILSATRPPLILDELHTESTLQASRYGAPICANPLAIAGATSPITMAGTALQSSTEILGRLIMSQLFQPGSPVIARPIYFMLDLSTGRTLQSPVEAMLGSAATIQFIKEAFNIPTMTFGFSNDSYISDGQAMLEIAYTGILVALAGCDLVHAAGCLDVIIAASPVQLVTDNKIAKMLKRIISGIKVDDDTMAWKEISDTDFGGNFLELSHTLKHCRETLCSGLSVSQPRDDWLASGGKDLYARMVDEYKEVKKTCKPRKLPDDVRKEFDSIVKRADEDLRRK